MSGGECQTKNKNDYNEEDEKPIVALDEGIVYLLNYTYPYAISLFSDMISPFYSPNSFYLLMLLNIILTNSDIYV